MSEVELSSIPAALEVIKSGGFVLVMDDIDRENEGDLIMAAEFVNEEKVAFALRYGTGILCTPMTQERADHLRLPRMVIDNKDPNKTAFTVSVDSVHNTTGVSAADRARTMLELAIDDSETAHENFTRPGHTFPLVAKPNGVLQRRGHTEAAVDLCKLAGVKPVGFIVELQMDDGNMMRLSQCADFAKRHNIPLITVEELVRYRSGLEAKTQSTPTQSPLGVKLLSDAKIPLTRNGIDLGEWIMQVYKSYHDFKEHVVLIRDDHHDLSDGTPVLTRVHSECFTGDLLGSQRCDCGDQLTMAMQAIADKGRGVIVYLTGHEGRGIGLANKIKAYKLQQERGLDTYAANAALGFEDDLRSYETALGILRQLKISSIDLITDNKNKAVHFESLLHDVVTIKATPNRHNAGYLLAKAKKTSIHTRPEHVVSSIKEPPSDVAKPDAETTRQLKIAVVRAAWNSKVTKTLADNITSQLKSHGVADIDAYTVHGCYELPWTVSQLCKSGKYHAVVATGVLFKGETLHFEMISQGVTEGLMQTSLTTDVPVINAVLNCLEEHQAIERSGVEHAKSLANTTLHMASLKYNLQKLGSF